jgi:hypothetical protein
MNLSELFQKIEQIYPICIDHQLTGNSVLFRFENRDKVDDDFSLTKNEFVRNQNDGLEYFFTPNQKIYEDKASLLSSCGLSIIKGEFGILCYKGKPIFVRKDTAETHPDIFFRNIYYYLKFLDEFSKSDLHEHHNSTSRIFILVSGERGKFEIGYTSRIPNIPDSIEIKNYYDGFIQREGSADFRIFFREQIIQSLEKEEKTSRFISLVVGISQILESTQRNYEFYLSKFKFEDLFNNFRREQENYFARLRDLLNQILSKLLTIPISISAAVVAINNLKGNNTYIVIILLSYLVFSAFTAFLIHSNSIDLKHIC